MLFALVCSSVALAAPVTVALDVSTVDAASFEALDGVALEKTATVRLVQEGFAVVAPTASPNVLVSVSVRESPRAIVLSGTGPGGTDSRSIVWASETLAELHLEVTQKVVELTRLVARAPVVHVEPISEPEAPAPRLWSVGASGGVLLRDGGLDALGVATVRFGERFRFAADLGVDASRGTGIGIVEGFLAGGVGYALSWNRWQLEASLTIGALLHWWSLDRASSGVRAGVLVRVPIQLTFMVTPAFGVGLRVAPGWSSAREHSGGDLVLWARGAARFETQVGVIWAL